MAGMEKAVSLHKQLSEQWRKGSGRDLDKIGSILQTLKVQLTALCFLPGGESQPSKQELVLARDVLEIGAQWSIARRDIPSFERYMSQLKCYYFDYRSHLDDSPYRAELLGLNLLSLLAQNRLAEFHTELELLPVDELQSNVYLRYPVVLEQYLMEGCYNKVLLSYESAPAQSYRFFLDVMNSTVRDEIASCVEKAYGHVEVADAMKLLVVQSESELREYASGRGWSLSDGVYKFATQDEVDVAIPAQKLIVRTLDYAKELEKIV